MQSVDVNKYEHSNGTLSTTIYKPMGGEGGFKCPVFKWPIDNFLTHPSKIFMVNEHLSD